MIAGGYSNNRYIHHKSPSAVDVDPESQVCEDGMEWCMYIPYKYTKSNGTSNSTVFAMMNIALIRAIYQDLNRLDIKDLVLACSKDIVSAPRGWDSANGNVFSTECLVSRDSRNPRLLTDPEVQQLIEDYRNREAE